MTSSRSIRNRWLVALALLVMWMGVANAGRKRVVVLDFDGPKAEKFHEDVVKLLKKSHTVLSVEKWNGVAEELDAGKVTEKNVKKIAKKLKVDAVITGKIDKRRDEYIIKLKLRSGVSGELTGTSVQTKAEGPRLDGQAQRDIKDELITVIDDMESNRGGGGGDEEAAPEEDTPKKKKKDAEEVGDEQPKKSGFSRKSEDEPAKSEDEDKPKKHKDEDEPAKSEDEDKPKKKKHKDEEAEALSTKKDDGDGEDKPKKHKKRKASSEDGEESEEGVTEEAEEDSGDEATNLSPAGRAIDAVVGLSFTARNLKFVYAPDLGKVPPGYRQSVPVAGAVVDLTVFPLSFGHKRKDILTGIGLNILYDQVLVINSRKRYLDGQGTSQTADLSTKESRWLVGGVFRYPVTQGPKAIVVGGGLSYGKQTFSVAQTLPNMEPTDIPNVAYSMITPSAFVRFPITTKIIANLDAGFHAITNTGAIQSRSQYGAATVSGYSVELGADYMISKNLFARAGIRYQAINFTFKADPMSQNSTRDTDPEQDVTGAKDTYFGGSATVGYVY